MLFKTKNTTSIALMLVCLLGACSKNKEAPTETPVEAAIEDPFLVTLTPELKANLRFGDVTQQELVDTLRIPGRIQVDEHFESRAGAPVTGRITTLDVQLGDYVRAGQRLATINSTELAQYQLSYIKASQQMQLLTKALDRAKLLLEADVISLAELQKRETELAAANAELNASRDQLLVLGMMASDINKLGLRNSGMSTSQVTSKIGGTVIERKASLGQVVAPAEELFVIADLSKVWAVAEIPEQQVQNISKGQSLDIEVPALNDAHISATLSFVGDVVNPEKRTVIARADIPNKDKKLKPDMLITILVESHTAEVTAVPVTAVVRENNNDYVYLKASKPDQFRMTEVKLGRSYHGYVEVKDGLKSGDYIVMDGAFYVNNERKRKELE